MMKSRLHLVSDLNRLDRESDMLLATVLSLNAEEMAAPSRCEGWTRAHVVAHLARNADGIVNLVTWATTGTETPQYPSPEAREQGIQEGAAQSPDDLKADLQAAIARCREALETLKGDLATESLSMRNGMPISPYELPSRRATEVIVHHFDLDTLWEFHEADTDALLDGIEICVGRLQADPNAPGLTIRTDEADEYVIGDGATTILGGRDEVLGWLARGHVEGHLEVEGGGDLPTLPSW